MRRRSSCTHNQSGNPKNRDRHPRIISPHPTCIFLRTRRNPLIEKMFSPLLPSNFFNGFSITPHFILAIPTIATKMPLPERCSVLVVGSGNAGLSAAISAAQSGAASVLLIDKCTKRARVTSKKQRRISRASFANEPSIQVPQTGPAATPTSQPAPTAQPTTASPPSSRSSTTSRPTSPPTST